MTSTFEERLAVELTAIVSANPAPVTSAPRPALPSRRLRGLALGGAGAVAVTATAVLIQAGGAAPAFAVDTSEDGTVTVTIERAEDAAGLQKALRDQGVNAYVDYLPDGKACAPGRFTPAAGRGRNTTSIRTGGTGTTFTITSSQLQSGAGVVIEDSLGGDLSGLRVGFAAGEVKPCTPVDANTVPGPDDGPGQVTEHQELPSPAA